MPHDDRRPADTMTMHETTSSGQSPDAVKEPPPIPSAVDEQIRAVVPSMDAPFFQAGLAGYSDAAMRLVARRHGCPYAVTEALLDTLLLAGGRGRARADLRDLARRIPEIADDRPLAGQIIGTNPDEMAQAGALLAEIGYDVIDVNLACPVKKIKRKNRGGHFLAHPDDAISLLRAVRDAVPPDVPTTVKLRRGTDDSPEAAANFEHIFNALYELGYAWATVHGRTVQQKYIGPSRWPFLAELTKRYPDRLIFGSGDIFEPIDIFRMMHETGVHAISVARGCIGNPWIFCQARQLMAGETPQPPTLEEQRDVLLMHFELSVKEHGERMAGRLMRKFGIKFSQHHPRSDEVKICFTRVRSLPDWRAVLDEWYKTPNPH